MRPGQGERGDVQADAGHVAARSLAGRETGHIDALYRQWHRRPGDLKSLRELRTATSEHLDEALLT
jgi:hypothetical protein